MIRRSTGRTGRWLLPLLLLLFGGPLAAQDPPRPPRVDTLRVDTARIDTIAVPPDTPVVAPTERQLVRFPAMPISPAAGPAAGEWVWDRPALLREGATSILDLLRRLPGLSPFRAGMYVQPEIASPYGGTAGRVEIEVDGYVLDPLAESTFDLAQFPLTQVRELRVERRLGLLRIRILTDEAEHALPYTRIEAGVGQPAANLFRGIFLVPHFLVGPIGLAVERFDTDGSGRNEPASLFSGWAKWAWTDGRRGAQVELLQGDLEREPNSPWPVERSRRDVVLRLRNAFSPGVLGEVYAGRSSLEEAAPPLEPDTLVRRIDRTVTQAGFRAAVQLPQLRLNAGFRYRDADFLPQTEIHADGDGTVGPLRIGGEVSRASWQGANATLHYGAHAEVGLPLGASVFGEYTGGRRGAPRHPFFGAPLPPEPPDTGEVAGGRMTTIDVSPVIGERSGWRAGLALQLGQRASGSIAYISLEQDQARPFGLPFDTAGVPVLAGPARGIEAYGRLVIVPRWLAVESWINDWQDNAGWAYMPARSWRTALELHASPLPTGNLEILARVEGAQRGSVLVWLPDRAGLEPGDPGITAIPAQTVFNAYLQIRVIDVRAYIRWEDLTAQQIEELPGRIVGGQRIFYGVKWNLWN